MRAAANTIQIHGGIGFTWDNDTHLWFKRAKSSEVLFGDPNYHRELMLQRLEGMTMSESNENDVAAEVRAWLKANWNPAAEPHRMAQPSSPTPVGVCRIGRSNGTAAACRCACCRRSTTSSSRSVLSAPRRPARASSPQ